LRVGTVRPASERVSHFRDHTLGAHHPVASSATPWTLSTGSESRRSVYNAEDRTHGRCIGHLVGMKIGQCCAYVQSPSSQLPQLTLLCCAHSSADVAASLSIPRDNRTHISTHTIRVIREGSPQAGSSHPSFNLPTTARLLLSSTRITSRPLSAASEHTQRQTHRSQIRVNEGEEETHRGIGHGWCRRDRAEGIACGLAMFKGVVERYHLWAVFAGGIDQRFVNTRGKERVGHAGCRATEWPKRSER
jgi:hypothetical protein